VDAGRILYALCCEEACGLDHECGHEVEGVERVPGPAARLNIAPPAKR
jgi:hypothetical protein